MLHSLKNHSEMGNPAWDTILITLTTIVASALIFSVTAVSSTIPPQSDHLSTVSAMFTAYERAGFLHTTNYALLTLALAVLPLVVCLIVLPRSAGQSSQASHPDPD